MPRLLSVDQKRTRKNISMYCLAIFNLNPKDFLSLFVTVDETWIYTWIHQQESKQWTTTWKCAESENRFVGHNGSLLSRYWNGQKLLSLSTIYKKFSIIKLVLQVGVGRNWDIRLTPRYSKIVNCWPWINRSEQWRQKQLQKKDNDIWHIKHWRN